MNINKYYKSLFLKTILIFLPFAVLIGILIKSDVFKRNSTSEICLQSIEQLIESSTVYKEWKKNCDEIVKKGIASEWGKPLSCGYIGPAEWATNSGTALDVWGSWSYHINWEERIEVQLHLKFNPESEELNDEALEDEPPYIFDKKKLEGVRNQCKPFYKTTETKQSNLETKSKTSLEALTSKDT